MKIYFTLILSILMSLILSGCATQRPPKDYTIYKAADPRSILILPPKNASPDVKATYSVYSHTQRPLAESGFYVFPISVVDEVFKSNGLTVADEIHLVSHQKLHQIFGADTALYITIKEYGTQYMVLASVTTVSATAQLVDLRSGQILWDGSARVQDDGGSSNQGGLVGLLVGSIVNQIMGTVFERGHDVARTTMFNLLAAGGPHDLLCGPYHPLYKNDYWQMDPAELTPKS